MLTTIVAEGSQDSVSLTSADAPEGITVSFDPDTVQGAGSSSMTMAVGAGTHTGRYSIVVTGSAGGIQKTAPVTLNVTAQVFLHWSPSDSNDIVGYNIARSTTPGQGYTRINSALISDTSYSDGTVQSGRAYYYVATAVNSAGQESPASNEAVADVP